MQVASPRAQAFVGDPRAEHDDYIGYRLLVLRALEASNSDAILKRRKREERT